MTPDPIPCPHCGSCVRQTKAGFTLCGSQRYHCHACGRLHTPFPKQHGYSPDTRQSALRLYLEGNGFRRIARLLGVSPQTVSNWVNTYQARLQEQTPQLPVPEKVEVVEMDELYTFLGSKKTVGST